MDQFLVIILLLGVCALVYIYSSVRSAKDVMVDLVDEVNYDERSAIRLQAAESCGAIGILEKNRFGRMGVFSSSQRKRHILRARLLPWMSALLLVLISMLLASPDLKILIAIAIAGLALGYLAGGWLEKKVEASFQKKLEFYLPVVMERIVMAVQAGLDIMPAIKAIVDLEDRAVQTHEQTELVVNALDPVSRLLKMVYQLTEAGLGFEQSLREVAGLVDCSALRHAFVHLAVAQKEGGELVMPLKELSDATQLYYQESIEEDIAKLPVKATMPLVCTFAGLIICFITAPLLQVMSLTSQAVVR